MTSHAITQQTLITNVFEASSLAVERLAHLVPALDRDRLAYAVATALLEEAWVSGG